MAFSKTTQDVVLEALVFRLRDSITELNDNNCFVTSLPWPDRMSGNLMVTVSPDAGTFDDRWFAGGGKDTIRELATVDITAFTVVRQDRAGRDDQAFFDARLGLLVWKAKLVKALFVGADDFTLRDEDGNGILTDQLFPINASAPARLNTSQQKDIAFIRLVVGTNFLWDV